MGATMKLPKEYSLLGIIGLFLLAYILDYIVDPLSLDLVSPYHFFQPHIMSQFPFSTVSVFIKAAALFFSPLWLMAFFKDKGYAKPILLLVLSGLVQLYAIQDLATRAQVIPLEWALSLTAAGAALLIPTIFLFFRAMIVSAHRNLSDAKKEESFRQQLKEKTLAEKLAE